MHFYSNKQQFWTDYLAFGCHLHLHTLLRYFSGRAARLKGSSVPVFLFPSSVTRLNQTGFELHCKNVKCIPGLSISVRTPSAGRGSPYQFVFNLLDSSSSSSIRDPLALNVLTWSSHAKICSLKPAWYLMLSCVQFLYTMTSFHSSKLVLSLPPSPSGSLVVIVTPINTPAKLFGPSCLPLFLLPLFLLPPSLPSSHFRASHRRPLACNYSY